MANKTELVFILDESGSMSSLTADTIGGFNGAINQNKLLNEDGETFVTLTTFSNTTKILFDYIELGSIPTITTKHYAPNGMTAMYDGIGTTLNFVAARHPNKLTENEKVIVAITTDGMENASCEYNGKTILEIIDNLKSNGWEFVFVAANIDEQTVARNIGIDASRTARYNATSNGTHCMHEGIGSYMYSRRMGIDEDTAFYTAKQIIIEDN